MKYCSFFCFAYKIIGHSERQDHGVAEEDKATPRKGRSKEVEEEKKVRLNKKVRFPTKVAPTTSTAPPPTRLLLL